MRIGYLCMESTFSVRPLEALLAAGHDVRFVMRPLGDRETRHRNVLRRQRAFDFTWRRAVERVVGALGGGPVDDGRDPFRVAAAREIPAWLVGDASSDAACALVQREKLDVLVVAFFNQLLKPHMFQRPRLGAINLHPSLLPLYRGPSPLFWMYRDGCEEAGLTVHKIAPGEDDGDVLLQERIPLPLGTPGEDLVDTLAARAGELVVAAVDGLATGQLVPRRQQGTPTRAPRPADADLVVHRGMSPARIFHFVRGVGRWNRVLVALGDDDNRTHLRAIDAVDWDESRALPGEFLRLGGTLHLACAGGSVTLQVRDL